jgi:threonine/homoserine/homoserine lactone efflux protein
VVRLRDASRSQAAITLFVAALVLLRLLAFALQPTFASTGDEVALRLTQLLTGIVSTIVDVVVLFVVLLLFDARRRIEREPDRIQAFMDNVYRGRM